MSRLLALRLRVGDESFARALCTELRNWMPAGMVNDFEVRVASALQRARLEGRVDREREMLQERAKFYAEADKEAMARLKE